MYGFISGAVSTLEVYIVGAADYLYCAEPTILYLLGMECHPLSWLYARACSGNPGVEVLS